MSISAHRLMAWLSPSFPTGAFAYSHGLEYAVHAGQVCDPETLQDWIETILRQGAGWNDAILLAQSYRGYDVADLATALAGGRERQKETVDQGRAFAKTASNLLGVKINPAPLPIAIGKAAAIAEIELAEVQPLYLHSFVANLVSAAVRLIPIGQSDGQLVLQALFAPIDEVAMRAEHATIDELSNTAFLSEIAAMKHEEMGTRIFRT